MVDAPVRLYKYLPPERAATVLRNLLIRFSQVSVLNDELEFKPPLKGVADQRHLENVLVEKIRERFPDLVAKIERVYPPETAEQFIKEAVSKGALEAEDSFPKSVRVIYEKLDTNFGILSLSETSTDMEMWLRYADDGRGFLIEFDPKHSWFWCKKEERDGFRHLRQVVYQSGRSAKYLLDATDDDYLYTKNDEWAHEIEWRIIRNFNDAAVNCGPDTNGKDVLLFAIPPDCVRTVISGYGSSKESEVEIRRVVAGNPELSHVRFNRAVLRENDSVLVIADS